MVPLIVLIFIKTYMTCHLYLIDLIQISIAIKTSKSINNINLKTNLNTVMFCEGKLYSSNK